MTVYQDESTKLSKLTGTLYVGVYKNLQWVYIDAEELPLFIQIYYISKLPLCVGIYQYLNFCILLYALKLPMCIIIWDIPEFTVCV